MLRLLFIVMLAFCLFTPCKSQNITLRVTLKGGGCESAPVRFEASVNSMVTYTCRWWKVGVLRDHALTANSRIYEILSARLADAGQYYCVVTETETGRETFSDTLALKVVPLPVYLPEGVPNIGERDELPIAALDSTGGMVNSRKLTWSYGTLLQWQTGTAVHLPSGSGGNPFNLKGGNNDILLKVRYDEGVCVGYDSMQIRVKPSRYYWGGADDGYARVSSAFRVELNTPSEREYCEGETLRFKVTAISDGSNSGFSYQWWHIVGGNNIAVSNDTAFRLSPARIGDAGAYYCEVRDESGFTVLSDTQYLKFSPAILQVQPRIVYAGEGEQVKAVALSAEGDTIGGNGLKWYAGGILSASDDSVYCFTAGATDVFIKAVYTNKKGCAATDSLRVITKSNHLSFGGIEDGFSKVGAAFMVERVLPLGKTEEFCSGGEVPLKAQVTGENNANYTFRWWKIARPADRLVAESDSIMLKSLSAADAGLYYCETRDANGYTAYTDTLLLTLHNVELPGTSYATAGEHITFTAYNTKGEIIKTPVVWYERMDGDPEFYPLTDTDNPLIYTIGSSNTMLLVESNLLPGCRATDSTRVIVRTNGLFKGTYGDGFDATGNPPVIIRPYLPVTVCSAYDSVNLQLFADGTNLQYRWQVLSGGKEWVDITESGYGVAGGNSSLLQLTALPEEYRGVLRCLAYNDLDTAYSHNITVFGHHLLKAVVDPEVVRLGEETSAAVTVRLEHGIKPWTYRYETPRGVVRLRSGLRDSTDMFSVSDLGMYPLTYLSDSLGCEVVNDLPKVEVTTYKIPKITISGDNEVCQGNNVNLLLSIQDGIGPWEVSLNCNGVPAENLGISWPLKITTRDTSVWFYAYSDGIYTVDTIVDLNKGGKSWGGVASGSAFIKVREADDVRFKALSDNHVGTCRPVDLLALLQPAVNGVADNGGSFYADGFLIASQWTPQSGVSTIRYMQQPNAFGCASQTEVELIGDARPSVQLVFPHDLCENDAEELLIKTVGNTVIFELGQRRMGWMRPDGSFDVAETVRGFQSSLTTNEFRENVKFMAEDSCLVYTVRDITDKYGCQSSVLEYSDTLYHRRRPSITLYNRYPDMENKEWVQVSDTLWTKGDRIGIKGELLTGDRESVYVFMRNDRDEESLFSLGEPNALIDEGTYRFKVTDAYCVNEKEEKLVLRHTSGGYFRLKAMLEGEIREPKELIVELLDKEDIVAFDTCLVLPGGVITNRNGSTVLSVQDFYRHTLQPLRGRYQVAIHCEGYLSVTSKRLYGLGTSVLTVPLIDFTDENNVTTGSGNIISHMTCVGEQDGKKVWGMSATDTDRNEVISVKDGNEVVIQKEDKEHSDVKMTRRNRDKYN